MKKKAKAKIGMLMLGDIVPPSSKPSISGVSEVIAVASNPSTAGIGVGTSTIEGSIGVMIGS